MVKDADGMEVWKYLDLGYIIMGHYCGGHGITFDEAVDDWVETVRTTMAPGGFYLRSAEPIARRLKKRGWKTKGQAGTGLLAGPGADTDDVAAAEAEH